MTNTDDELTIKSTSGIWTVVPGTSTGTVQSH